MDLKVDVYFTLAIAAALLVLGGRIVGRVPFLSRYSIPEPVVGGLLAAFLLTVARPLNFRVQFDTALQTPFNIMFFTTVGLAADVRSVIKGGRMLALFFVSILGVLVFQNLIGWALALTFGIHPANGLLAGSITLAGGHVTGAAWGEKFVELYQLQGAVALAIACATYGLVAGGLLGGPFARWLIQRYNVAGS
jgi:glutamate:Na+ symporter, ESS family